MKQHLNLSVDHELVKRAKEADLNLSEVLQEAIEGHLNISEQENIDHLIEKLIIKVDKTLAIVDDLKNKKQKLDIEENNRINKLRSDIESCPELLNLTEEQLRDVTFLGGIVDIIRAKYNTRLGVANIQEYYKLIEIEKDDKA